MHVHAILYQKNKHNELFFNKRSCLKFALSVLTVRKDQALLLSLYILALLCIETDSKYFYTIA